VTSRTRSHDVCYKRYINFLLIERRFKSKTYFTVPSDAIICKPIIVMHNKGVVFYFMVRNLLGRSGKE
jgi:hypothetical protein